MFKRLVLSGIAACMIIAGLSAETIGRSAERDYRWVVQVTTKALPGVTTVPLSSCPAGVRSDEREYWVYLDDPGNAEAVRVTGGTCKGDDRPGTLQFSTKYAHNPGYTIGSASDGLQEALIAARFRTTSPAEIPHSAKVAILAGEYRVRARVSFRSSDQMVDLSGATVQCDVDDACLFVGDPTNSNLFANITIVNPLGRALFVEGTKPFIEVNAQKTRLFNVTARRQAKNASFGALVQVDDDQAFLLDGMGESAGIRCDAKFCGSYVRAPGPFNVWSAVGWLKNLNISANCGGNGVDWQSGNTLHISDSVIQGYAQFGVRTGVMRGGYGPSQFDNVYMEVGSCVNPVSGLGIAGVISEGGTISWRGGEGPQSKTPLFTKTGKIQYDYYLVPHHPTYGYGVPLYAGKALTNGSGKVIVRTPDVPGADRFDLLRRQFVSGQPYQMPYGTGTYAVTTHVTRASACVDGVCTFTDPQEQLRPYTVSSATYFPRIDFWASDFFLSSAADTNSVFNSGAVLDIDILNQRVLSVRAKAPSVFAKECGVIPAGAWVSCISQIYPPETFYAQGALLLPAKPTGDGGEATNLKGRFNLATLGTGPGHLITLSDSNFAKTIATGNHRPTNDPNDAYIGYDRGNSPETYGISFGAPVSLSSYIGNVGDGRDWKERLDVSLKTFKVPVSMPKLQGITDSTLVPRLNADMVDGKHANDFVGYASTSTCNQSNGGKFNYVAGGKGVKDTVQVCAKAADGTWAWRTLY